MNKDIRYLQKYLFVLVCHCFAPIQDLANSTLPKVAEFAGSSKILTINYETWCSETSITHRLSQIDAKVARAQSFPRNLAGPKPIPRPGDRVSEVAARFRSKIADYWSKPRVVLYNQNGNIIAGLRVITEYRHGVPQFPENSLQILQDLHPSRDTLHSDDMDPLFRDPIWIAIQRYNTTKTFALRAIESKPLMDPNNFNLQIILNLPDFAFDMSSRAYGLSLESIPGIGRVCIHRRSASGVITYKLPKLSYSEVSRGYHEFLFIERNRSRGDHPDFRDTHICFDTECLGLPIQKIDPASLKFDSGFKQQALQFRQSITSSLADYSVFELKINPLFTGIEGLSDRHVPPKLYFPARFESGADPHALIEYTYSQLKEFFAQNVRTKLPEAMFRIDHTRYDVVQSDEALSIRLKPELTTPNLWSSRAKQSLFIDSNPFGFDISLFMSAVHDRINLIVTTSHDGEHSGHSVKDLEPHISFPQWLSKERKQDYMSKAQQLLDSIFSNPIIELKLVYASHS